MDSYFELDVGVSSLIEWPCIYMSGQYFDSCIELSLSEDNYVGYSYGELGINLFLPFTMVHDKVAQEISALWVFLFESKHITNACVRFTCHRQDTWRCLKKKRHKNHHVSMLLRQIFWHLMYLNVLLEVIYDPLR